MSARADVLAAIRRSIGATGTEQTRIMAVDDRLERAPRGVVPQRGQVSGEDRLALFRKMAEYAQASIDEVPSPAEVPAAVASYLRQHNLPATLRMGEDSRLQAMPWGETALDIATGPSAGQDLTGLSHAVGGVAETGTLALTSGADNPTTLNFLPDNHIVVVREADLSGDYEDLWRRLRFAHGKGAMPRTVNLVTGPSRSGDIEQTILLGAHGPRRLHIVIVRG